MDASLHNTNIPMTILLQNFNGKQINSTKELSKITADYEDWGTVPLFNCKNKHGSPKSGLKL